MIDILATNNWLKHESFQDEMIRVYVENGQWWQPLCLLAWHIFTPTDSHAIVNTRNNGMQFFLIFLDEQVGL